MACNKSVLIIDDDPDHLRIYGWLIERAGYRALLAQVKAAGIDFPEDSADLVVLDYHLMGSMTAAHALPWIKSRFPNVPILLLSSEYGAPSDVAAMVDGFVRKGEPEMLMNTIARLLPGR